MRPHLLLTYDFPPNGGGIARMMGELALRYPERSLIVSTGMAEGSAATDATLPGLVHRLDVPTDRLRNVPTFVRWSFVVGRLARAHDVSFCWSGTIKPATYPARWLLFRRRTPYGVILYGGDALTILAQCEHSRRKRMVARALLGDAALIVAISEFTRGVALEIFKRIGTPYDPARVVVVPLGTDPQQFRPDVDPAPARTEFKLPAGRWMMTVARLTPHKGVDVGIQALARLATKYPDLRYAVAGRGPDRERLVALATSLGVADRLHWLGSAPDEFLPGLYRNTDIYLGLSRQEGTRVEGFGISLLEASATGVPVIGGRAGGVPDAVRDGETGILVDPTSVDEVARTVERLLDDPALARRLGEGGRKAVLEHYNWTRVAADFRRLGDQFSVPAVGAA
jgi:phosphatidylinositol alpha-1,6-mannosyltransferase